MSHPKSVSEIPGPSKCFSKGLLAQTIVRSPYVEAERSPDFGAWTLRHFNDGASRLLGSCKDPQK